MNLLLLTIDHCPSCKALKSHLDTLQYLDDIQMPFTFSIINVEKHKDGQAYVDKYNMQAAPLLISPSGDTIVGSIGKTLLKKWIEEQLIKCKEQEAFDVGRKGSDPEDAGVWDRQDTSQTPAY